MDASRTIVCLADRFWNDPWSRRQQFAQMLAEARHDVLYVEPQCRPRELPADTRAYYVRQALTGPVEVEKRVHVFTPPPSLPLPRLTAHASRTALGRAVREALGAIGLGRPVVIATRPEHAAVLDAIEPSAMLLDPEPATLSELSAEVLARSTVVLAESEGMRTALRDRHADVRTIPNGVWWANYRRAIDRELKVPAELEGRTGPFAVVHGPLDDRIDFAFLQYLMGKVEDLVLLLAVESGKSEALSGKPDALSGKLEALREKLEARLILARNVTVSRMPEYLARASVALVPWKTGAPWDLSDPQCAYESLAAGLPVVATSIPSLRRLENVVFIAGSPSEFVEYTRSAISGKLAVSPADRSDAARAHAWNGRVHALARIIDEVAG